MGLIERLKKSGFSFTKSLGQNFITDEGYLDCIVRELGVEKNDTVVEVGTGAGTLTRALSRVAKRVITIEIDKRLEPVLQKQFDGIKNIDLFFDDALQLDLGFVGGEYKLVANIPYYITTPLVTKFMRDKNCTEISVLVQEELGQRMVARVGTGEYGAFTVAVALWGEGRIVKRVPRNIFTPIPNVDSVFVRIKRQGAGDEKMERFLKTIFASRRKKMSNAAKSFGVDLESVGINPDLRPEQITPEQFAVLFSAIKAKN